MPPIVPGFLHPSNSRHVLDWNEKGVLAYGCHNLVFLIDAFSLERIQVLDLHSSAINCLAWCPETAVSTQELPRLASADISGCVVISDPISSSQLSSFSLPNSTVEAMFWFLWKDMSRDFLIVLHSSSQLVLWNADSGERIWAHQYTVPLFDFSIDHFNPKRAAFSTIGAALVVISDLHLNSPPSAAGNLIQLSNEEGRGCAVVAVKHHKAYRNVVFASTSSTIFCVDQDLCCVYSKISLDGSSAAAVLPVSSRDAVFTVSLTGAVQLRTGVYSSNDDRADAYMGLERMASTDAQRVSPHTRVASAALCPVSQTTVAVLFNSGRIVFWQLESDRVPSGGLHRSLFIEDLLSFGGDLETLSFASLRLRQTGVCCALSAGVTCVRVRPLDGLLSAGEDNGGGPLAGRHLAAVGTNSGSLHLVDVFTSQIVKEFSVQSSPIRCVEWASPHSVLSAGYNHALSSTHVVRNDVFCTDIRTGVSSRIRPEADETPITMIRVSFYQSYVAIAFQREPLEIWDLRGMRLLRKMSRACPLIVDMAWSCKHCTVKTTENSGQPVYRENLVVVDSDNRLYHIVVKGLHVRDGKEVNTQWKSGGWAIRCMAWKDDVLAMGDADGRLAVWDLSRRQSKHSRAERSPVIRMQFSRLAGDHTLAVLHQSELVMWDTESLYRQQVIRLDGGRAALDMDLCGVSPVLLCSDCMLRSAPGAAANTPMQERDVPILLTDRGRSTISSQFLLGKSDHAPLDAFISRNRDSSGGRCARLHNEFHVRRWCGDIFAAQLLQVALRSLLPKRYGHLPPNLQLFWDSSSFKEREMRVVSACCRLPDAVEERVVERAVVLGGRARDRAVDRLIGAGSGDLRLCSLKAALLVSTHDGEQARSLIKLIATNLIASDLVEDGVELLFVVGAGADACRYLQSQAQWSKSVAFAKMGLLNPEDVLQKWTSHLAIDQKSRCALSLASRSLFSPLLELLSSSGWADMSDIIRNAVEEVYESTTEEKDVFEDVT